MSWRKAGQQPTGPEQLQRRINVSTFLTGSSTMLWLVPIILGVATEVDPGFFAYFSMVVAAAASVSAFLFGLVVRAQRKNQVQYAAVEDRVNREHDEILKRIEYNHTVVLDLFKQVATQVERASVAAQQDYWNSYADALADSQGGPAVVNGTETRSLDDIGGRVVHLPRHNAGGAPRGAVNGNSSASSWRK